VGYKRRSDANHSLVAQALRSAGWFWLDTHAVPGFFDGIAFKHGRVAFVEIKDGEKKPSAQKLTPAQVELHADVKAHGAEVVILTSVEQAVAL
jgi:hypothetical protein